jgi:SAM-dependent methyltransferase
MQAHVHPDAPVAGSDGRVCTFSARAVRLDLDQWGEPATRTDRVILDDVRGPVLDVGCGPGRLVAALRERGVGVLGIDAAPTAIAGARARGRRIEQRSVFDPLPREGSWATVLLFDGNIGIGGEPTRLLTRARDLISADGSVIVELEPPGTALEFGVVQLEVATGMVGWFPWCWVGTHEIRSIADDAGLEINACREIGDRWFVWLGSRRPPSWDHERVATPNRSTNLDA